MGFLCFSLNSLLIITIATIKGGDYLQLFGESENRWGSVWVLSVWHLTDGALLLYFHRLLPGESLCGGCIGVTAYQWLVMLTNLKLILCQWEAVHYCFLHLLTFCVCRSNAGAVEGYRLQYHVIKLDELPLECGRSQRESLVSSCQSSNDSRLCYACSVKHIMGYSAGQVALKFSLFSRKGV